MGRKKTPSRISTIYHRLIYAHLLCGVK